MSKFASGLGTPLTGRHFEDQLLLAIIDAYADAKFNDFQWRQEREKRLTKAKSALFGASSTPRPAIYKDEKALYFMASEYMKDAFSAKSLDPSPKIKLRSTRQLAREAKKFTDGANNDAIEDRLRKAFELRKDELIEILQTNDFIAETEERNALKKIFEVLDRNGIRSKFQL